jgi:Arm domain-containing DNA-binding protein
MPTVKLTAAFVERMTVESGVRRTTYWDESLPGFGVLVTEKGHKSYVVQYRTAPGRTGIDRRMTLKTTLKLDDARREAKAILGQVATRCGPAGGTV